MYLKVLLLAENFKKLFLENLAVQQICNMIFDFSLPKYIK